MSAPPTHLALERHAFLPNPLAVIAPITHALAGQSDIPLAVLAAERFIMRERGSGTRLACDSHFSAQDFTPKVRMELGSNEAIIQAVAGGLGLAVISRHALASHLNEDQLTVLDVKGFPLQSNWWTLYPRGKRLSPVTLEFLKHIERTTAGTAVAGMGSTPEA
jgi:DNA-binding transcriptional LysR family regulator